MVISGGAGVERGGEVGAEKVGRVGGGVGGGVEAAPCDRHLSARPGSGQIRQTVRGQFEYWWNVGLGELW